MSSVDTGVSTACRLPDYQIQLSLLSYLSPSHYDCIARNTSRSPEICSHGLAWDFFSQSGHGGPKIALECLGSNSMRIAISRGNGAQ